MGGCVVPDCTEYSNHISLQFIAIQFNTAANYKLNNEHAVQLINSVLIGAVRGVSIGLG